MNKISLLNPSISSNNIGDEIISFYAKKHINNIFKKDFIYDIPTHEIIGFSSFNKLNSSKFNLLGGSNILNGKMLPIAILNNWKIGLLHYFKLSNIILMGCGWSNYQNKNNLFSNFLYKKILNKKYFHSVRDNYTYKKLKEIGIKNIINTGCHTMWGLTEEHCKSIPITKSENVIFTLTYYRNNIKEDIFLINTLLKKYKNIYFWPQQINDFYYFKTLGDFKGINILAPKLDEYNKILKNTTIDYIGSRLHGGIHALNNKKRTIIISVDNRALEISKDTNLKIIETKNLKKELVKTIDSIFTTKINLPNKEIKKWKEQFKNKYKNCD